MVPAQEGRDRLMHRCANCYVAQYGMKSDVPCKNEWAQWLNYQAGE